MQSDHPHGLKWNPCGHCPIHGCACITRMDQAIYKGMLIEYYVIRDITGAEFTPMGSIYVG